MKRVAVLVLFAAAAFFFLTPMDGAGQLLKLRRPACPSTCPTVTGPSAGCNPLECPAPEPSLPISETESISSQRQGTALEPVQGTGSKSPTGLLGNKVTHTLDAESIRSLRDLLSQKPAPAQAAITLPMEPATSERLSRLLMLAEALLWLATAIGGGSAVGRFGPLALQVVRGLLSAVQPPSPPPTATPTATSSNPTNP